MNGGFGGGWQKGDGGLSSVTTDSSLSGNGTPASPLKLPYKIYSALLTQSGTDAPVATVLENTIGAIVWTRNGVGDYYGTLAGAFPDQSKVWFSIVPTWGGGSNDPIPFFGIGYNDANSIYVESFRLFSPPDTANNDPLDDLLFSTSIEIRVYP